MMDIQLSIPQLENYQSCFFYTLHLYPCPGSTLDYIYFFSRDIIKIQ